MKKLKNTLGNLSQKVILVAALSIVLLAFAAPAFAADTCGDNCSTGAGNGPSGNPVTQTTASNPNCNNSTDAGIQKCIATDPIVKDINLVVNFLSVGVAIVIIGAIIVGGIQYTMAGDNSTATQAARKRITDALIALVAFIFTFAFLQWIIPGGL